MLRVPMSVAVSLPIQPVTSECNGFIVSPRKDFRGSVSDFSGGTVLSESGNMSGGPVPAILRCAYDSVGSSYIDTDFYGV